MAPVLNQQIKSDETLMRQIWATFQAQKPLQLYNVFHGVPISYPARIVFVNRGYITVQTHPYQAVCISIEKRTYLQGDLLQGTARAHPIGVDVADGEVILTRIGMAESTVGRRLSLRVQPSEPVRVDIRMQDTTVTANLADLSFQGVGIYTFGAYINDRADFRRGDEVSMQLEMRGAVQPVQLHGRVTNISRERNSLLYRVGVQMASAEEPQKFLHAYIDRRRKEILQELEETCRSMGK